MCGKEGNNVCDNRTATTAFHTRARATTVENKLSFGMSRDLATACMYLAPNIVTEKNKIVPENDGEE